jgi:hypothetical protein
VCSVLSACSKKRVVCSKKSIVYFKIILNYRGKLLSSKCDTPNQRRCVKCKFSATIIA